MTMLSRREWDLLNDLLAKHLDNGGYYDTLELLKEVARDYARLKIDDQKVLKRFLEHLSNASTLKSVLDLLLALHSYRKILDGDMV